MNVINLIKKTFTNSYLWVRTKLQKQMAIHKINEMLAKHKIALFESFKQHCADAGSQLSGFIKFIREDSTSLTWSISDYNFLLEAEIKPFAGIVYMKTYRLVKDSESHPNTRLHHISGIDMTIDRYGNIKYVMPRTVKRNVMGTEVESDASTIFTEHFNQQYCTTLMNYMESEESTLKS